MSFIEPGLSIVEMSRSFFSKKLTYSYILMIFSQYYTFQYQKKAAANFRTNVYDNFTTKHVDYKSLIYF